MPLRHCCFGDLQPRPAINGRRYTNRGPLMNRTFRKVWSRARGTVVVASELAKRRGAGARATQTNRGVGIGLLALALAATGSVYAQRSEERRVGKECVRTGRSWGAPRPS